MFVFVVGIGEGVFVCGREWAVFVLVVGIGLSSAVGLCFMVEICEVGRSWSGEWICGGWARQETLREEKARDELKRE